MELGMILCSWGFETIDQNLQNLIDHMRENPNTDLVAGATALAKAIGLCIALGVGSYECYMMILGRRGMDVMKILHIIIISLCITCSGWIAEAAKYPGTEISNSVKTKALAMNQNVADLETQVSNLQTQYLDTLRGLIHRAELQRQQNEGKNATDYVAEALKLDAVLEFVRNYDKMLSVWAMSIETTICEWLSIIIRFIGEILFQISYYGILVAQNIFLEILKIFCPILFALSLAPPFRSAWSQWLSKYISISLWGFVVYMILYYVNYIMQYNLQNDIESYQKLIEMVKPDDANMSKVAELGMQGLGTTCMYVVGCLVGVFCLRFVPDVASWLIPGGVGSPIGGAAVGVATGAAGMATSGVTSVAGAAVGGAPGAAMGASGAKSLSKNMQIKS